MHFSRFSAVSHEKRCIAHVHRRQRASFAGFTLASTISHEKPRIAHPLSPFRHLINVRRFTQNWEADWKIRFSGYPSCNAAGQVTSVDVRLKRQRPLPRRSNWNHSFGKNHAWKIIALSCRPESSRARILSKRVAANMVWIVRGSSCGRNHMCDVIAGRGVVVIRNQ